MIQSERAETLMAKGPIWLVRRVMELEVEPVIDPDGGPCDDDDQDDGGVDL